jgi:type VI protein secretion system component VasK
MKARTRNVLTAVSATYLGVVVALAGRIPWELFNRFLVAVVVPLVWLIWTFASWSATQHSKRWERDIAKVHRTEVREAVRR